MHKCIYKYVSEGNTFQLLGHCDHPQSEHREGTCWHIVKPELKDKDNIEKYCPCVMHPGNIKPFASIGYMPKSPEDWMITKECKCCKKVLLLRTDTDICKTCEVNDSLK